MGVEPSVASIAYIYYLDLKEHGEFNKRFMTFDFGGGTLDCSVLSCTKLKCTVLGISGNSTLGGIDFDRVIADILEEKVMTVLKWEITEQISAQIASLAEEVKKELSDSKSKLVNIQKDGVWKEVKITYDEFSNHPRTQQILDSAIKTAKEAMNDPRLDGRENIRAVELYSVL